MQGTSAEEDPVYAPDDHDDYLQDLLDGHPLSVPTGLEDVPAVPFAG